MLINIHELKRFSKSTIEEIRLEDLRKLSIEKEEIKIIVSSMRLDNIISELAKCSRNKAVEILSAERVFLNFELFTKISKEVKEEDVLTIRGKGRFKVLEIIGNTKKGRYIVKIEKFK